MDYLVLITETETYKQILKDSFGGVMYQAGTQSNYDSTELLTLWNQASSPEQESAGGILKGVINFLQEKVKMKEPNNNRKNKGLNKYKKYCPNVFVAQCHEKHTKGDTIILTTKYGKEQECTVHNFIGYTGTKENPFYCYSITRVDGYNAQERAKAKAAKLKGYSNNATKRSKEAYKKTDLSEEATGIPLGQPILIGHHSEKRHRRTIERSENAMRKSVEEEEKAEEYSHRSKYWEDKANDINLSMPESLEFYEFKLSEAKEHHKDLKDNPNKRTHSFSLTYANKKVNELTKKLKTAKVLWGEPEVK